jgi:hypothetical protein
MVKQSELGFWRIPHNQFLGMLYIGGLLYLLAFLIYLYKVFKLKPPVGKSEYSFSHIYPFIGFVILYLTNPNELVVYFPMILAISCGVYIKTEKDEKV